MIITQEGIPLNLEMVAANVHDLNVFEEQIKNIKIKIVGSRIIGDKGYTSTRVKENLEKKGITLITPAKKKQKVRNTEFEKELLRERSIVENVLVGFS